MPSIFRGLALNSRLSFRCHRALRPRPPWIAREKGRSTHRWCLLWRVIIFMYLNTHENTKSGAPSRRNRSSFLKKVARKMFKRRRPDKHHRKPPQQEWFAVATTLTYYSICRGVSLNRGEQRLPTSTLELHRCQLTLLRAARKRRCCRCVGGRATGRILYSLSLKLSASTKESTQRKSTKKRRDYKRHQNFECKIQ